MENPIQKYRQQVAKRIIESTGLQPENESYDFEKARSGVYADTAENRKKGRVGQKYGSKKGKEEGGNLPIKVGDYELTFDSNLITLFSEMKKDPEKYKRPLEYLEKFGSNYENANRITLAKMILESNNGSKKGSEEYDNISIFLKKKAKTVIDNKDNSKTQIPANDYSAALQIFASNNDISKESVNTLIKDGILVYDIQNIAGSNFFGFKFNVKKLKDAVNSLKQ